MTNLETPWNTVGQRVRELRTAAGLTGRELARRIGVSASHVSQVERGIGAFSGRALYAVASVLGVQMHDLLDPKAPPAQTAASALDLPVGDLVAAGVVRRAADHPSIKLSSGPRWGRLTAMGESGVEFLEVVYDPGPAAPPEHIVHDGREYGVIIEGELSVELQGESTVLRPGDSIVFDSLIPHRFWNAGEAEVRAIWFVRDRNADDPVPHA